MQDERLQIESPAAAPARPQLSWRERRWERRRKRRMVEEVLGWVLVPVIVAAGYFALEWGLTALGTSPAAVIQALGQLRGSP